MNTHELPMILFTVIAQLSVGTFIVLGVVDLALSSRHRHETVRRITEPVLYAIGPALVLGLAVSTLHMNDITNVFNVVRNWDTSWLSREILLGMGFAGFGFLFAVLNWYRWGGVALRRIVGLVTAVVGIALVWSMSQIYASLEAVPAWNTPIVAFHFLGTTILLGALAVGCALMVTVAIRRRNEQKAEYAGLAARDEGPIDEPTGGGGGLHTLVLDRVRVINAPTSDTEWRLITRVLQWIAVVTAITGVALLISYPVHVSALAAGGEVSQASAAVFSGAFFIARLVLLGTSSVVLGLFAFQTAARAVRERPGPLVTLMTLAFVLAFIGELMGRSLHYDSMLRIGM